MPRLLGTRTPLKDQVYAELRSSILRSSAGSRLQNERDLAAGLGVSRPTLRTVLQRLEREGLVDRRHGNGTFITDLVRAKTAEVLFFHKAPGLDSGSIYARCLRSMKDVIESAGHNLSIVDTPDPKERPGPPLGAVGARENTCALATLGIMNPDYIAGLSRFSLPLVTVDYDAAGTSADSVTFDSFGAGRMLAGHLIGLGHRDIAFVGCNRGPSATGMYRPESDSVRLRAGFECAMQEQGYPARPAWVREVTMNYDEPARQLAHEMLRRDERPAAAVVFQPSHAEAFARGAEELGLSVPGNLTIGCFGQAERPPKGQRPFPTVAVSMEEMGQVAGHMIVERLSGRKTLPVHVAIPGRLLVRSTEASRKENGR